MTETGHLRALCIVGSPRREGNTAFLVGHVAAGMADSGVHVACYVLGDLEIGYCRGCRTCEQTGRCVQRDDVDRLTAELTAADIVLVASPSYWGDVTGQLKTFIDRCLPLCNAASGVTPVPPGKVGVAVAIRTGRSSGETQHIVETIAHYFGHLGIEPAASLTAQGIETVSDFSADKVREAYELGARLPHLVPSE
jgi:multimeric flavodoxin WrbA